MRRQIRGSKPWVARHRGDKRRRGCGLRKRDESRRAVFLDRDGTIAEDMGYVNHVERFRILPGSGKAIRKLNEAGFAVIVITNQSGVARGYFPESLVGEVHKKMLRELGEVGAVVDAIYYCPPAATARFGSGTSIPARKCAASSATPTR